MNVEVGETYKFSFDTDYNTLNGIYKVLSLVSYDQILLDDVDLIESLYGLVGKSDTDLATDLPTIKEEAFYSLENVVSKQIIK